MSGPVLQWTVELATTPAMSDAPWVERMVDRVVQGGYRDGLLNEAHYLSLPMPVPSSDTSAGVWLLWAVGPVSMPWEAESVFRAPTHFAWARVGNLDVVWQSAHARGVHGYERGVVGPMQAGRLAWPHRAPHPDAVAPAAETHYRRCWQAALDRNVFESYAAVESGVLGAAVSSTQRAAFEALRSAMHVCAEPGLWPLYEREAAALGEFPLWL